MTAFYGKLKGKRRTLPQIQKELVMIDRATVHAWKTYDPQAIGNLFSEDAIYTFDPFSEPVRGRAAIVAAWLDDPDALGTYDGHYEPIMVAASTSSRMVPRSGPSGTIFSSCASMMTDAVWNIVNGICSEVYRIQATPLQQHLLRQHHSSRPIANSLKQ